MFRRGNRLVISLQFRDFDSPFSLSFDCCCGISSSRSSYLIVVAELLPPRSSYSVLIWRALTLPFEGCRFLYPLKTKLFAIGLVLEGIMIVLTSICLGIRQRILFLGICDCIMIPTSLLAFIIFKLFNHMYLWYRTPMAWWNSCIPNEGRRRFFFLPFFFFLHAFVF